MFPLSGKTVFGFVISSFAYDLSLLLYTWSTPDWFNRFPNASGFRFILAVSVYCLCCIQFFALRSCRAIACSSDNADMHKLTNDKSENSDRFIGTFLISFIPVLIFSVLVLSRLPLQTLYVFLNVCDIAVYICICFSLSVLARQNHRERTPDSPLLQWFWYGIIQIATVLLLLIPSFPGFVSAAGRMTALALCLFLTLFRTPLFVSHHRLPVSDVYGLSRRETEILELVYKGKTNEEIACALYISISTVKTHLSSIFLKTGTRNRTEAAALCRKN